jgi:hypothetical protein
VTLVLPEQQTDVARLAQRLGHEHSLKSASPRRQGRSPKRRLSAPRSDAHSSRSASAKRR